MYSYDIRRFCPEVSKSRTWVEQRSHEAYAKNYSTVFPHDEPLAGRNAKKVSFGFLAQTVLIYLVYLVAHAKSIRRGLYQSCKAAQNSQYQYPTRLSITRLQELGQCSTTRV